MDQHDSKIGVKRERDIDDDDISGPQMKRQRPNTTIHKPMKITDLDDICLEKVFDHLDLISLFNVAVANQSLRSAARQIYKRRFGQMQSLITGRKCSQQMLIHYNSIDVHGLKTCLQYLRCFGPSISNLCILYGMWNEKQCGYIHQHVIKYCADTLISISFQDMSYNPDRQFVKPFAIVQEVSFFDVDLGSRLSSLPIWFPNVNSLKLHSIRISRRCIDVPFQHLKHLYLDIAQGDGNGLSVNQARHLVSSNRQLDSLHLFVHGQQRLTPGNLLNMIEGNKVISKLIVTMYQSTTVLQASHIQGLKDEHPLLVELTLRGFIFTTKNALKLFGRSSGQFNLLKSFCFQLNRAADYDLFVSKLNRRWKPSKIGLESQNTVKLVRQD